MHTKLHFDIYPGSNDAIAYYNGDDETAQYRVVVEHDDCPENPFESWDGHWPMIVDYYDRRHNFRTYDSAPGPAIDKPLDRYSDGQIIRHQKAIAAALGGNNARYYNTLTGDYSRTMAEQFADDVADYRADFDTMADCKRYLFEQALEAISDSDKLEALAALYDIIGIPALCTSSHGYSQGDYAELLIVATPEAQAQFGWKPNSRTMEQFKSDMEAQAALYSAWAWGDVYSYSIERRDGEEWCWLDCCAGFYGYDHEKSGLAEQAIASLEYHSANNIATN